MCSTDDIYWIGNWSHCCRGFCLASQLYTKHTFYKCISHQQLSSMNSSNWTIRIKGEKKIIPDYSTLKKIQKCVYKPWLSIMGHMNFLLQLSRKLNSWRRICRGVKKSAIEITVARKWINNFRNHFSTCGIIRTNKH